jgi:hypothetical protein
MAVLPPTSQAPQAQATLYKQTYTPKPSSTNLDTKTNLAKAGKADQLTLMQKTQKVVLPTTKQAAKNSRKYWVGAGLAILGVAAYHKLPISAKLAQQHGDKLFSSAKQAAKTVTASATPISTALQEAIASATSKVSKIFSSAAVSATDKMAEAPASATSAAASATGISSSTIKDAASRRIKDTFDAVRANTYCQKVSSYVLPSIQSLQNKAGNILATAQKHPLIMLTGAVVGLEATLFASSTTGQILVNSTLRHSLWKMLVRQGQVLQWASETEAVASIRKIMLEQNKNFWKAIPVWINNQDRRLVTQQAMGLDKIWGKQPIWY